mmetsp:Transcript_3967/g.11272  ORF Transcript_3967/g.11272 Transcript_3967/m.11272 type:complete len:370 (+) Transcript_3967:114-1223(+)
MAITELYGKQVDLDDVGATAADLEAIDALLPGGEHGWLKSPDRERWMHYRKFVPSGRSKVKAVLVYQHGIQGNSGIAWKLSTGRVTNFALLSKECLKRGFALYTPDMSGHGISEGTRFFIPKADWTVNRDDLEAFARHATREHEDVPFFIGGESYGANLAINLAGKWQEMMESDSTEKGKYGDCELATPPPPQFSGFVVNAPAIIGDLPPWPITYALRYVLAPLTPTWVPPFMPNPVNADAIWSDEEVRALETSDHNKDLNLSGCGKAFRLGTAAAMITALENAREVTIPSLKVPFCVCHGSDDRSVPIAGSEYLLEHCLTLGSDRAFRKEEGSYHDILAEKTAEASVSFVLDWILERCDGGMWRLGDM